MRILGHHYSEQVLMGILFVFNGLLRKAKRTAISHDFTRSHCALGININLVKPTGKTEEKKTYASLGHGI